MRRHKAIWGPVIALALLVGACGTATTETTGGAETTPSTVGDTAAGGGTTATTEASTGATGEAVTVTAAVTGDEGTINPFTYVTGFPGWNLLMMQYDSLMQFDAAGLPQLWLAESVEPNPEQTEFKITIVDGVTWHDGEPLTIDDVAFTFNYFIDNAVGRFARALSGVETVVVDGDRTMTVTLSAPNPAFDLTVLADVPIIPQHIWQDVTNPQEHLFETATNVGSGPYRLVEYTEGQSYRFEAFDGYFRGEPSVDELVVVVFADDTGPLAAIRSGEIDVIFDRISPEQIGLLNGVGGLVVSEGPEFSTQMINFDVSRRPFDDLAVRQAISLAVDRQDIVDTVFLGSATVGSPGWVHPDKPEYNPAVAPSTDVAAANALLDGAGYLDSDGDGIREYDGEPMSFELLTNSSDSLRLRIAELSAEMLAEIGIEAVVASVESSTWEEAVWPGFDIANGRNYEMAIWGWSAPIQATTIRVADLVHSDPGIGFLNLTGFADPEVDEVAGALLTEGDATRAAELTSELQALIADRVPFVLLAYPDGAYVYDSSVYDGWEFIAGQGIVSKVSLLDPSARP
jgi:peptide/nickel transport system substrate-binding protein